MRHLFMLWLFLGLLVGTPALAENLQIAAAGSLRQVLPELITRFQSVQPDIVVRARYGSSGQLAKQLVQGAPDALFLSADEEFAQLVSERLQLANAPVLYALGSLVLFRPNTSPLAIGISVDQIIPSELERLAIAQPDNAPYGRAARSVLQENGIWQDVQSKLAIGENVAQAAQFAASGNVDLALIAQSQALSLAGSGDWTPVDLSDERTLRHTMIVTDPASPAAKLFFSYLLGPDASTTFSRYGFESGR